MTCVLKGKRFKQLILFFVIGGYVYLAWTSLHPTLPSSQKPLIFYSTQLHDDLKLVYIHAIKQAKSSIHLQIYGLTDPSLISLLSSKKQEGIDVKIIHDKKASQNLPKQLNAIPAKCKGLMHRKILIIDDTLVFLGTANFTTQSLKMHDNLVLGTYSRELAEFLQGGENQNAISIGSTPLVPFYFPDKEGIAYQALAKSIENAKKSIQIAMFTLTHKGLITKLSEAQKRGVNVSVAIDRYTARGASRKAIETLKENGAEILLSQGSQLLHHKWVLIDGETLAMGSANWTQAAFDKNQDCLLLFKELNKTHKKTFNRLWKAVAIASEKG